MKNNNHIVIQGWMINELNLKGNDLIVYALIYGFSQDGESKFTGSCNYIAEWLNATRQTAMNCLKNLVEKEYIVKEETETNGVKFCKYYINFELIENLQGVKNFNMGCKNFLHNNINNTLSKDKVLLNNIDKKSKSEKITVKKSAKIKYLEHCSQIILEYDFSEKVIDKILEYLENRAKLNDAQLRTQLEILSKFSEKEQLESLTMAIGAGWKMMAYPKKQPTGYKKPKDDIGLTREQEEEMWRQNDEHEREVKEAGGVSNWIKKNNLQKF